MITQLHGDCRDVLPTLERGSVQCIVTSPPYFGLRQYGDDPREIGREQTPAEYVAAMVEVFRLCRDVLADDGVLWLNVGDSYAGNGSGVARSLGESSQRKGRSNDGLQAGDRRVAGLPAKSLIGIPWRLAFALQDDGWVLRSDVIWHKPNQFPDGAAKDRPTRDHEYLFLFSKRPRYFYDTEAIREPTTGGSKWSYAQAEKSARAGHTRNGTGASTLRTAPDDGMRNRRTVWSIPTDRIDEDHPAPMPERLAELCILAGSRPGDTVLDPFGGSGTTARVAEKHGRHATLIDLYGNFLDIQTRRLNGVQKVLL